MPLRHNLLEIIPLEGTRSHLGESLIIPRNLSSLDAIMHSPFDEILIPLGEAFKILGGILSSPQERLEIKSLGIDMGRTS